ncbi:DUF1513 domain-containing protein [Sedimentitalea todarodis]|uniref:DUF1513 domain-containing protein n=1 Tax=Sedimentitalea todarodis TaxID=1631240 RepID=A0ABU3V9R9_9RHOB|nr:DUF1513 domain-containing protein [Sedimentitalea todarodis]MDU9002917.1 DUF1513 domain-containing protein [Sedimentitalea todarodis]
MQNRRRFLTTALAAATLPRLGWADAGAPSFLAAAREPDGAFALFGLSRTATPIFRIPLPGRGHAAAAHPLAPEAVAFARRPGHFALVIDCAQGQITHHLSAPDGRHFYGHGAFIADGDILCTTENEIDTGAGRIGLWSRREEYRRIGEFSSGGIGPHDILRLDGDVLAIANGGIRTHPAHGRDKLNLETMRPNFSYLSANGEILEQVELTPDLRHDSIRHLAASADGTLAFAMQWQRDVADPVPLLGLHKRGNPVILAHADLAEAIAMQGYAGSIAIDGTRIAITSPRGGRVQIYDRSGNLQAVQRRADACGIAPCADGGFVVTDGLGGTWSLTGNRLQASSKSDLAWDNHLIAIG